MFINLLWSLLWNWRAFCFQRKNLRLYYPYAYEKFSDCALFQTTCAEPHQNTSSGVCRSKNTIFPGFISALSLIKLYYQLLIRGQVNQIEECRYQQCTPTSKRLSLLLKCKTWIQSDSTSPSNKTMSTTTTTTTPSKKKRNRCDKCKTHH